MIEDDTKRVRVQVGTIGVSSTYIRVPKGTGPKKFGEWCQVPGKWLVDENGRSIRASAIVAFAFVEDAA
jgi:hypothetical protein